jgi:site-specific recombinase XerD
MKITFPNGLACAIREFFSDFLPRIRGMSPHTICSYRDAILLLLRFLAQRRGCDVVVLDFPDMVPDEILAYLEHLEIDRHNTIRTRNVRLASIHAFARYVATRLPEHLELCQRLLAVPFKRAGITTVGYLETQELSAILSAPDRATVDGRRDYTLLLTLFNTGARVQEVLDLRPSDLQLVKPFQVRLLGKGRKQRICPLWQETVDALRNLLSEINAEQNATERLFRNHRGEPLTRFGIRYILRKYSQQASKKVKTLEWKRVHPHTLRHTTAVHLLQAGVDLVTISHWLGHASVETTNRYATVDLEMKRAALAKAQPVGDISPGLAKWRDDTDLIKWLEGL